MGKNKKLSKNSSSKGSPGIDNDQLGENVYEEFSEATDFESDIKSGKKSKNKSK